MKKLATLLLTAGLLIGATLPAQAVDFKIRGQWIMGFDFGQGLRGYSDVDNDSVYGSGGSGAKGADNFNANQRVRLHIDAVVSETLSGTVYFEIGETQWGNAGTGGALGADQPIIELKNAYIDWFVPETDLKVRMGLQSLALPSFTTGSQIFEDDVAGIVLSNQFNDVFGVTMFWARPFNDNYVDDTTVAGGASSNFLDNIDTFALLLPFNFGWSKITPWVMYSAVGQNFARNGELTGAENRLAYGLLPYNVVTDPRPRFSADGFLGGDNGGRAYDDMYSYGDVIHGGFTGEITGVDPFRFAWDFNYGYANFGSTDDADDIELRRQGYMFSFIGEYKTEWATPGLYMWYSSGDDANPDNGSERLPTYSTSNGTNQFSPFASHGHSYLARESVIGENLVGTWGLGLRFTDVSFFEDLTHNVRMNYIGGTNSVGLVEDMRNAGTGFLGDAAFFNQDSGMYLTTKDYAVEFGFGTNYALYENLDMYVDASYLVLNFDHEVWGDAYTATDAWNVSANFIYSF